MSYDIVPYYIANTIRRSPWLNGYSDVIPIYSGKDGCLRHWCSWNRGVIDQNQSQGQKQLSPPNVGEHAVDVTPKT